MEIVGVILAVIVLVVVISWWSEGYIGATEGFVLFVVYGGLVFGLFAIRTSVTRVIIMIPLLASAVWSVYLIKMGSLQSYYCEKVKQYEATIDFDPQNSAARSKLAKVLYALGQTERAIIEMQMAIDISPTAALEDRHTLKEWQLEDRLIRTGAALCYRCGRENERGLRECVQCGLPLRRPVAPKRSLKQNTRQFAVITAGFALAGISLALLPLKFAFIPIGCGLLAAAGWNLLRSK